MLLLIFVKCEVEDKGNIRKFKITLCSGSMKKSMSYAVSVHQIPCECMRTYGDRFQNFVQCNKRIYAVPDRNLIRE